MQLLFSKRLRWLWLLLFAGGSLGTWQWSSTSQGQPVCYVNRYSEQIDTEQVAGENWLHWLYENPLGKATLNTLVKRKFLSSIYGAFMDSKYSQEKINPFIKKYHIDTSEFLTQDFSSFNDFFTRKLKPACRPIDSLPNSIIAPADGKLLAIKNIAHQDFLIKGTRFNIYQFLNDSALARSFQNGSMIIVRLCPTDYHRFHFPCSGKILKQADINGDYYSVSPIALREITDVFLLNKRSYTLLKSPVFDSLIIAEVGATMVGSIVQTYHSRHVEKGQEKGFFKFGGSTVVLFFKPNTIQIDSDLLHHSAQHIETAVKMGEHIATAL